MANEMLILSISRDIVEVILHQLQLDYDQDDAEDKIVIIRSAKDIITFVGDEEEAQHYEASRPNKFQFAMIVPYFSVGISLRQCSKLLLLPKEISGLGALGNISVGKVIQVVQ